MSTHSSLSNELKDLYAARSTQLQEQFSAEKDGRAYIEKRTVLVESVVLKLWEQSTASVQAGPSSLALVALGDFGRRSLFPYSELDLLFLAGTEDSSENFKDSIQRFTLGMSDLGLDWNPTTRIVSEFGELSSENAESILALLDCRFLAGDQKLFASLRNQTAPELMARESHTLVERLAEMTRTRHRKFANTIFHLEPNVKDGPGGYRDYILANWLAMLWAIEKQHVRHEPSADISSEFRETLDRALSFLASTRCFLNFYHKRDDNILTWDAQNEAMLQRVGGTGPDVTSAPAWMRIYFGHASSVERISSHLLEEMPAAQSLFYRQLETWRTGFSDQDFSVVDGLIFLQRPESLADPDIVFRAFRLIAKHGFKLSPAFEHQLDVAMPSLADRLPEGGDFWRFLQEILAEQHAAEALRAMHSLHVLTMFLPELRGIDALAVRDYSHRFTVDEHTLQAIENLHALPRSRLKWDQRYAGILRELDRPELLYLAILLHDTGKGVALQDYVQASVAIARGCLERLKLSVADRETVLFLVEHHPDMGAALRRDIFDSGTIAQFAENVGTPDRLKMLCLFTYADIKAVNPEALTPWKAEDLWQLYIGTANYLARSVDERVHADANDEVLNHLRSLAPAAGKKLQTFLEGLPRRYLRTHPVDEILTHFEMANRLVQDPVQLALKRTRHWYELTVVTVDRPFLFATVAGALAACGMNIGKAGAFSNHGGTVVDTFSFTDRFRALEMNLPEWERFKGKVHDVLTGKEDLERLLRERLRSETSVSDATAPATQIQFDDGCSAHSTLIEVVTPDRPGLLYRISSIFSKQECNIDIALIDTEGHTAIDVFYLTSSGGKLTLEHQERLRQSLLRELRSV